MLVAQHALLRASRSAPLLSPDALRLLLPLARRAEPDLLDAIGEHWAIDPNCEISLEANPTSVEAGRFRDFRAAGVNRVSLGVQALNDADLKALGRMHSTQEALDAVAIARRYFERYSFDLI